jgi:hypothetical protein
METIQEGNFAEINKQEEIPQGEQPEVDLKIEERAKMQGWVPKEEFRGDPERHITAEEFVNRADHMMPILKTVNKKLETKLSDRDRELAETKETLKRVVSIQEKYATDNFNAKKAEIDEKKRKAIEENDLETYDKLNTAEKNLAPPEPLKEPEPETKPPEALETWFDENKAWWNVDKDLTQYAVIIGDKLARDNDPLAVPGKEREFADKIKGELKVMFPTKFENPNQDNSEFDAGDTGGGGEVTIAQKITDLPQEAQQQFKKLVGQISGYTEKQYLKDYNEE